MKSEHRHELADNDLEKLINNSRTRFAELMEVHGNRIMLWSSVALLVLAAAIFYTNSSRSTNAQGWSALANAQNAEDLAAIAESYQGKLVGHWAQLNVGEQYMQSGLQLMLTDRSAAIADLEESKKTFEAVLNEKKISDAIRERALFGLARVLETTSDGNLKPAIDTYQKLIAEFPKTAYKTVVEKRIVQLERKSTQEFYAWFAIQKPKPEDRELPADFLNLPKDPASEGTTPEKTPGETPADKTPAGEMKPGQEGAPSSTVPTAPDFPPTADDKKKPVTPSTEKTETEAKQKPAPKPTTETKVEEKIETKPAASSPPAKSSEPGK